MPAKPATRKVKRVRDQVIQVRTTEEVKTLLAEAAERAGVTLSAWITSTCVRVARAEREKAARAIDG